LRTAGIGLAKERELRWRVVRISRWLSLGVGPTESFDVIDARVCDVVICGQGADLVQRIVRLLVQQGFELGFERPAAIAIPYLQAEIRVRCTFVRKYTLKIIRILSDR